MNCREAMAVIAEFLEQSLSPETLKTRPRSLLVEELRRGRASS